MPPTLVPSQADAVFEGGGVKGIAFAGAVGAAEDAGVREWKNVAGTSAGAITACLLAVGYHGPDLRRILGAVEYRKFADYGWGGLPRGLVNSLWMRGLAPGRFFTRWLEEQIADSPLARSLGKRTLTFADVVRDDLPEDLDPALRERARYRLRIIASDITAGRMLVLPQAITGFTRGKGGERYREEDLGLVEAVRMSMSFPFLYDPVVLWQDDEPHYVVDGGLLSNFPVWLFDSDGRPSKRPTWGFRLHGGTAPVEGDPKRTIPVPFWRLKLAKAMFQAATEAWDRDQVARTQVVRTVGIPTGRIGTTDFGLTPDQAEQLRASGRSSVERLFSSAETAEYLRQFRDGESWRREHAAPGPEAVLG